MKRVILIAFVNLFINHVFGQYSGFYEDTIISGEIKTIEVLMYNSDSSILNRNIYEYDINGKFKFIEIGNEFSLLGTTPKIIKHFYDSKNRRILDSTIFTIRKTPLVETTTYKYFDNSSIERDFRNGVLTGELVKRFNKQGKLINKIYQKPNDQKPLFEVDYEYYINGKVQLEKHRDNYDTKKTREYSYLFTYYDSGLTKTQIENNLDTTYFFYSESKQLENVCFADSSGKECYTYQEAFGPEPLPFDSIYHDSSEMKFKITEWKLTKDGDSFDKFIYEYDKRDNWIKKYNFRDNQLFLFEERKIVYMN